MSVTKYAEVSVGTHNEHEEYAEARGACSMGWDLNWKTLQLRKGANVNIDAKFRVNKTCRSYIAGFVRETDVYLEFGI